MSIEPELKNVPSPRHRSSISTEEERREMELSMRRRFAGTRWDRPTGGDPTRTKNGEWMHRFVVDMPEAMRAELEERAQACRISADQVIRLALVEDGIGDPTHVVGIQDGTARDDD